MVNYSFALLLLVQQSLETKGFISSRATTFHNVKIGSNTLHMAPPPRRNGKDSSAFDDWLGGSSSNGDGKMNSKKESSGSNERADARLPISFFGQKKEKQEEDDLDDEDEEEMRQQASSSSSSSALERVKIGEAISAVDYENNPYLQTVTEVPPSEIINRFMRDSDPRVQDAVKSTILSLIGTLPRMGKNEDGEPSFKARVVTSAERLASLMFQLQLTGYMFKNAEYRMAISKSVRKLDSSFLLKAADNDSDSGTSNDDYYEMDDKDEEDDAKVNGKVRGKVKVKYAKHEIEVEADSYVSELRSEIKRLREEMHTSQKIKQEQDLLSYIRTLPPTEMRELTNVSEDILTSMKGLVNAVMAGIATEDDTSDKEITPATILEQSGEAIAQLCMWQLVSGYNLRELEIREQMNVNLKLGANTDNNDLGFTPGLQPGGME